MHQETGGKGTLSHVDEVSVTEDQYGAIDWYLNEVGLMLSAVSSDATLELEGVMRGVPPPVVSLIDRELSAYLRGYEDVQGRIRRRLRRCD